MSLCFSCFFLPGVQRQSVAHCLTAVRMYRRLKPRKQSTGSTITSESLTLRCWEFDSDGLRSGVYLSSCSFFQRDFDTPVSTWWNSLILIVCLYSWRLRVWLWGAWNSERVSLCRYCCRYSILGHFDAWALYCLLCMIPGTTKPFESRSEKREFDSGWLGEVKGWCLFSRHCWLWCVPGVWL